MFLASFQKQVVVEVAGLGAVRFCHGSPRSDEELVTPRTPAKRVRAMTAQIEERVLVTAHTHLQFDRRIAGIRSINAGSVGMPYEGRSGAFWAILGPDVDLRTTEYSLELAAERYRASGDPLAEQMVDLLFAPPTRKEVVEHAELLGVLGLAARLFPSPAEILVDLAALPLGAEEAADSDEHDSGDGHAMPVPSIGQ